MADPEPRKTCVTLSYDPPITALMLHRDVDRLQLTAGNPVQVNLPPDGLRIFQSHARS